MIRREVSPRDRFHVLRNHVIDRMSLNAYLADIIPQVDVAIEARRLKVQRRHERALNYRILDFTLGMRKDEPEMARASLKRRIETLLFNAYSASRFDRAVNAGQVCSRLVSAQVPLHAFPKSDGWRCLDVLAPDHEGNPVVFELKTGASKETPLRGLLEGVANSISVRENWTAMAREIRAHFARKKWNDPVAAYPAHVTTVILASNDYWERWSGTGSHGCDVNAGTRNEFRRLRGLLDERTYPTVLATFEWPFGHEPGMRLVDVDW